MGVGAATAGGYGPSSAQQVEQATLKRAPLLEIAAKRAAETVHALDAVTERLQSLHDRLLGSTPSPPAAPERNEKIDQGGMAATLMHMLEAQQERMGRVLRLVERLEQL